MKSVEDRLVELFKLNPGRYNLHTQACTDPACGCDTLEVRFEPLDWEEPESEWHRAAIDVKRQRLIWERIPPQSYAFAMAYKENVSEEDWLNLYRQFVGQRLQTEFHHQDGLPADFDYDEIDQHDPFVPYHDIITFHHGLEVLLGEETWLLRDAYQLRADLRRARFVFQRDDAVVEVSVNLKDGDWLCDDDAADELMNAALEQHGGIKAFRERERIVRQLYASHHDKDIGHQPVRRGKKVGRNEPCPCGSGKKYKKCCARTLK